MGKVTFLLSFAKAFFFFRNSICLVKIKSTRFMKWTHLTHYQTTNFRLFQTERVCRRQFQIWQKCKKVIQTVRKYCGKRRNCSLPAISPFPTVFSKGLFPRGIKRCHCVGMGYPRYYYFGAFWVRRETNLTVKIKDILVFFCMLICLVFRTGAVITVPRKKIGEKI